MCLCCWCVTTPPPPVPFNRHHQGTPVRYSKAVQLVHEFSGALLCVDVQERAESAGFAMKVVLKTLEPAPGAHVSRRVFLCPSAHVLRSSHALARERIRRCA